MTGENPIMIPQKHIAQFEKTLNRRCLTEDDIYDDSFLEGCDTIAGATGEFGYDKSNPIPVAGTQGQLYYLSCLRCECGKPFYFYRLCSHGAAPDSDRHMVDQYDLECFDHVHKMTLYFDMYHRGIGKNVPDRLKFDAPMGVGVSMRVEDFPKDIIEMFRE
jgi:hypothetical protein